MRFKKEEKVAKRERTSGSTLPTQEGPPLPRNGAPMKKKRPVGVILIAILFLISWGLNALSLVLNLSHEYAPTIWGVAPAFMMMYIINGILGIIVIIIAVGLLALKRWARGMAIFLAFLSIIMAIAFVVVAVDVGGEIADEEGASE